MFKLILTIILFFPIYNFAQKCTCEDNFKWLKQTFEENDAGFRYVIENKGEKEYLKHNEAIFKEVVLIQGTEECAKVLYDWFLFFRKGHLDIKINSSNNEEKKIIKSHKDWREVVIDSIEFKKYVSTLKAPTLEGVWVSEPYTFGIVKQNDEYVGFIIDAGTSQWKKNQIKFIIKKDSSDKYMTTYFMGDYSEKQFQNFEFQGNNVVKFGFVSLKRKFPTYNDELSMARYLEISNTNDPLGVSINENTFLIRIPSFDGNQKKMIDSLIEANHNNIISNKNLIIDLRFNGGGSDGSYQKLIPYLYTNPIRSIGVEYLSTALNNKRMEGFLAEPNLPKEDKEYYQNKLNKLNENLGNYVNLGGDTVYTIKYDTVLTYPQNVSIIVNEYCASTTEQFLLTAKQSKKVKIFGTTTFGALDVSNMNFVDFPCKELTLGYCITKSLRIPGFMVDERGIQPDFYIDKTIPEEKWIDYVEEVLK